MADPVSLRTFALSHVDVFTDTPYFGNGLAVVHDADGLDGAAMQRLTDWLNLSECAFLLPPTPAARAAGADYRVRIFCPGRELPFAGHPTLGACFAWLARGGVPASDHVVQECGAGLIPIRRDGDRLAFAAPPLSRSGPLDDALVARIARGLGLRRDEIVAHAWCDNGPGWCAVLLADAERVLTSTPDAAALGAIDLGVIGPRASGDTAFEVRAFFRTPGGLTEDPVTGSLNAALAQWLIGDGLAPERYVAAQGTALGRRGRVSVERAGDGVIWVGGHVVACADGVIRM
jgi:PhzF family phenazine biosynthesis protein